MAVITIGEEDFDSFVLQNKKPVLVEFYEQSDMRCRAMNAILAELADDLAGILVIAKVTTDDFANFEKQFDFSGFPCLMLFNEGERLEVLIGLRNKQQIYSTIKKYL